MICVFHKWSKWEEIEMIVHSIFRQPVEATYQRKVCQKCGKVKMEPLR